MYGFGNNLGPYPGVRTGTVIDMTKAPLPDKKKASMYLLWSIMNHGPSTATKLVLGNGHKFSKTLLKECGKLCPNLVSVIVQSREDGLLNNGMPKELKQLREFRYTNCAGTYPNLIVEVVKTLPLLESLELTQLYNYSISVYSIDEVLKEIASHCKALKELKLQGRGISFSDIAFVQLLHGCPLLKQLDIAGAAASATVAW
jgi:hypothetical protein